MLGEVVQCPLCSTGTIWHCLLVADVDLYGLVLSATAGENLSLMQTTGAILDHLLDVAASRQDGREK